MFGLRVVVVYVFFIGYCVGCLCRVYVMVSRVSFLCSVYVFAFVLVSCDGFLCWFHVCVMYSFSVLVLYVRILRCFSVLVL